MPPARATNAAPAAVFGCYRSRRMARRPVNSAPNARSRRPLKPSVGTPVGDAVCTVAALTTMVKGAVAAAVVLSSTAATKLNVPACVGVPLSRPDALSVRPGGSVPLSTEKVSGVAPLLSNWLL